MIERCKHGFPLTWNCGFCKNHGEDYEEKESKKESEGQSRVSRNGSS